MDTAEEISLPEPLATLSNLLDDRPESFATGNDGIKLAALHATKYMFDHSLTTESRSRPHIVDLLSSLDPTEAPQTRSQSKANGKRKRSLPALPQFKETPLSSLHVENVDPDQVWAQLELRAQGICDMLQKALDGAGAIMEEDDDEEGDQPTKRAKFPDLTPEDYERLGINAETLEAMAMEEEEDSEESDGSGVEEEESDGEDNDLGESVMDLRDPEESPPRKLTLSKKSKKAGNSELDDGFFDLSSFNAETEEAEAKRVSRGRLGRNLEGDDSSSDEDNDSVDYFAPVDGDEAFEGLEDTEPETYYKDFFDPPSSSTSKAKSPTRSKSNKVRFHEEVKVKNIKAKGKSLPVHAEYYWDEEDDEEEEDFASPDGMVVDDEEDGEDSDDGSSDDEDDKEQDSDEDDFGGGRDVIERSKGDLFDDDEEAETDATTHQQRMAVLKEQISALEAENVAPKNWTLMGEAHARGRPQNSLLEEDLDFERVMKAVPLVTEDVVQELEARIKARILDNNFDDVRRRPMDEKPFLPSRIFQLQDSKSAQSLAEIYEGEYVAAQTGGVAGEDRDGKLKKEHEEIERLWEGISNKLDALCNAHFMPKQPKAAIVNISDTAAASLESALPTTQTLSTMLAPEEILTPSSSIGPRDRSEMTPGEKRALRGKERKMRKKTRDQLAKSVDKFSKVKGVKRQKEDALKKIVKEGKGVTVVGKKSKDLVSKERKKT